MGFAKRRKKLDPNFGKGFDRNQKRGKQKQSLMDSSNHLQSFEVQEGKLPQKYIELIANEQWHDWSIAPERMARMEDEAMALGLPVAMLDSIIQEHQKNVEIVIKLVRLVRGEQTIALDNQKPSKEITEIVQELAEMILVDAEPSLSKKRTPFALCQEDIDKTKALGSRLNELGGVDLMRAIAMDYVPRCDQKELELIWHGIGDWKA